MLRVTDELSDGQISAVAEGEGRRSINTLIYMEGQTQEKKMEHKKWKIAEKRAFKWWNWIWRSKWEKFVGKIAEQVGRRATGGSVFNAAERESLEGESGKKECLYFLSCAVWRVILKFTLEPKCGAFPEKNPDSW